MCIVNMNIYLLKNRIINSNLYSTGYGHLKNGQFLSMVHVDSTLSPQIPPLMGALKVTGATRLRNQSFFEVFSWNLHYNK